MKNGFITATLNKENLAKYQDQRQNHLNSSFVFRGISWAQCIMNYSNPIKSSYEIFNVFETSIEGNTAAIQKRKKGDKIIPLHDNCDHMLQHRSKSTWQ